VATVRRVYTCSECGAQSAQWSGQCAECGVWNTLEESRQGGAKKKASVSQYAGESRVVTLDEVKPQAVARRSSGLAELDRALGGGVVPGAVILIGGDPGIGKSTLLLQMITVFESGAQPRVAGFMSPGRSRWSRWHFGLSGWGSLVTTPG